MRRKNGFDDIVLEAHVAENYFQTTCDEFENLLLRIGCDFERLSLRRLLNSEGEVKVHAVFDERLDNADGGAAQTEGVLRARGSKPCAKETDE